MRTRSLGCLVLLILLSGCATPQATEEEQQTYDEAISVLQGDPQEAANRLETFLRVYPLSPLAEQAAWERSQLALASLRVSQARESHCHLRQVLPGHTQC